MIRTYVAAANVGSFAGLDLSLLKAESVSGRISAAGFLSPWGLRFTLMTRDPERKLP